MGDLLALRPGELDVAGRRRDATARLERLTIHRLAAQLFAAGVEGRDAVLAILREEPNETPAIIAISRPPSVGRTTGMVCVSATL
jgi:hypothetical protein